MINIFTILIITYIINICLLKSINNISLKQADALDACNDGLATWALPGTLKQFGKDVVSDVTTTKFFKDTEVYLYKTAGTNEEINHYTSVITPATPKNYATIELESVYYAKKGSSGTYTYEMTCDKTIPFGDCKKTTINVGIKKISSEDVYVDKCDVAAKYTETVPSPVAPTYTHLTGAKNKLLKSSIINNRMSKTINNKISTTLINSEGTKYCNVNNLNGYYTIFVGSIPQSLVVNEAVTSTTTDLLDLSTPNDVKYYNESSSGIEVICGQVEETTEAPTGEVTTEATTEVTTPDPITGADGNPIVFFRNKRGLKSLKAATDKCTAYNKFKIETDGSKHYFYLNLFYLGVSSTDKYSIPKSVADGVSAEDQWCFDGLEINKISIININIFIIIIVLLLSLI